MHGIKNKTVGYVVLLCGVALLTILPFFHAGFFPMHDNTQVARVYELFIALSHGMVPVRWVPDLGYGYGYPIFTFYAPFAYYVGASFMMVGFDALLATKIMIVLATVLAGVFMYFFSKDIWGEEGGFISAVLYLFAPYHAVNIYVRGAVAELWGMAFIPLVCYGIWNTFKTGKWRFVIIGSMAYAGIITSHNLTAMMVSPFLGLSLLGMLVVLVTQKQYERVIQLVVLLLFGILLSAYYWVPAVSEMSYTNVVSQISGTGSKYADHYVCLAQLWDSPWGYAGSAPGCIDGISFRIGKLHVLFVLLLGLLSYPIYKKSKEKGVLVLGSIILFLFSAFLTLPYAEIIWKNLAPMSYFQFPWRFLVMAVFFSSFLAGGLLWYSNHYLSKKRIILGTLVLIMTIGILALYGKLFRPQVFTEENAASLTNTNTIRYVTSKISDEYMPKNFIIPKNESQSVTQKAVITRGNGQILPVALRSQHQVFKTQSNTALSVLLQTAPFPAWHTYVDGREIVHQNTNRGIVISLPGGEHVVSLVYISTKLEKIGNFISLTSMLGLVIGIIYLHTRKRL